VAESCKSKIGIKQNNNGDQWSPLLFAPRLPFAQQEGVGDLPATYMAMYMALRTGEL
jgi:hypothetical protein